MSEGYTPGDCKKLYEIVDSFEYLAESERNNIKDLMFVRVLEVLKVTLVQCALDPSFVENILRNFISSAYDQEVYLKITNFLFEQDLEEAPLKLYDRDLGLYARWRLAIGK